MADYNIKKGVTIQVTPFFISKIIKPYSSDPVSQAVESARQQVK